MKRLTLVKFGGSLITDKSKEESVNLDEIDKLSSQINDALKVDKNLALLIGNGAGSFGHIQVDKYRLKDYIKSDEQKQGFSKVMNLLTGLNLLVVSSLIKYRLSAVSLNPSSIFISAGKQLKTIFTDSLIGYLDMGMIPVIYGDMVYDTVKGANVLSTDRQFYELAVALTGKNFLIDKVIFCGNTDGVIDENGKTIKKIDRLIFPKIQHVFFTNSYVDVTGGMKNKVNTALGIARLGVKSYIINGRDLKDSLLGNKFPGTTVI